MNEALIATATVALENELTDDKHGRNLIWMHGNACEEIKLVSRRHCDIELNARSIQSDIEHGYIESAESALAFLLFEARSDSFIMRLDDIGKMSLADEVDRLLANTAPWRPLTIAIDGLAKALSANPEAAESLLGLGAKLRKRHGARVRLLLTDTMGADEFARKCRSPFNRRKVCDIPLMLDEVEAARRDERKRVVRSMVRLLREHDGRIPAFS